jgi:hypothetical protein
MGAPKLPVSTFPPTVHHHFDHPNDWDALPDLANVRGWAYFNDGTALTGLRVAIGDQVLPGTIGHHRADVLEAFPDAPDAHCGFQAAFYAPRGTSILRFEARHTDGTWVAFHRQAATAPRWRWPVALGGGKPEDLLAGQLALVPQYSPRPIPPEPFPKLTTDTLPRLSIVTPNYNQGRWLEEAIHSATVGTAPGIDHHVRDGGSTDESRTVLERNDVRLASWVSAPDDGQAAAVRDGLSATTGIDSDLMAWLNADDFFLPGAVDFVRAYFACHPEIDVVYGNRVLVDEDSREIGRWHLPPHDDDVLRLYDFVPQETLFWRRRVWDRVNGVDPGFKFALDWDFLLRLQSAGARIVHLPRFLGAFRLHQNQKSQAHIGTTGQAEIDALRERSLGHPVTADEIIHSPCIARYLRGSAREALRHRLGLRRRVV